MICNKCKEEFEEEELSFLSISGADSVLYWTDKSKQGIEEPLYVTRLCDDCLEKFQNIFVKFINNN